MLALDLLGALARATLSRSPDVRAAAVPEEPAAETPFDLGVEVEVEIDIRAGDGTAEALLPFESDEPVETPPAGGNADDAQPAVAEASSRVPDERPDAMISERMPVPEAAVATGSAAIEPRSPLTAWATLARADADGSGWGESPVRMPAAARQIEAPEAATPAAARVPEEAAEREVPSPVPTPERLAPRRGDGAEMQAPAAVREARPAEPGPVAAAVPAEPRQENLPGPGLEPAPSSADRASPAPQGAGPSAPVANGSPAASATAPPADIAAWRLVAEEEVGRLPAARPASAMAAPPPAPGAVPPSVASQVAVAMRVGGEDRIEIRLDPPELGRVQIEMRVVEGTLHALLLSERPEVADILRRHAEALQRELSEAGFGSVSLDFAQARDDGGERSLAEGGRHDPSNTAEREVVIRPAAYTDTRLDIRL